MRHPPEPELRFGRNRVVLGVSVAVWNPNTLCIASRTKTQRVINRADHRAGRKVNRVQ